MRSFFSFFFPFPFNPPRTRLCVAMDVHGVLIPCNDDEALRVSTFRTVKALLGGAELEFMMVIQPDSSSDEAFVLWGDENGRPKGLPKNSRATKIYGLDVLGDVLLVCSKEPDCDVAEEEDEEASIVTLSVKKAQEFIDLDHAGVRQEMLLQRIDWYRR